jgi:hypothetical protein
MFRAMASEDHLHPFDWRGSPKAEPQPIVVRPRRVRLRVFEAAIALAAVAVIAVLALGGGAGPPPATPVSLAADVTSAAPGYRFTMQITASLGGTNVDASASGAITEHPASGSLEMTVAGRAVKELYISPYVYVQVPSAGTPWIKLDFAAYEQSLSATSVGDDDPSQLLDFLRASGSVNDVGVQWIDGAATTHYHALVDLGRYAAVVAPSLRPAAQQAAAAFEELTGSTTLPVDAWVDAHNRVRRAMLSVSSICTKPGPLTETITMDYFDYGRQPAVSAPPAAFTQTLPSQLATPASQALSQLGC